MKCNPIRKNQKWQWLNPVIIVAGFVISALILSWSGRVNLVKEGLSEYKILVSENALLSEKYAASELQTYIQKISGARLAIIHEAGDNEKVIYVGFEGVPPTVLRNLHPEDFGAEEYVILPVDDDLVIAGGGSRGTLYGVIGYLTDHLGCHWYTREVSKIPSLKTIPFPEVEDRQMPAFEYRETYWKEAKDTVWAIHNRMNGMDIGESLGGSYITYPFVHTFYDLLPPEKYFAIMIIARHTQSRNVRITIHLWNNCWRGRK